jgi:hypothetical protein
MAPSLVQQLRKKNKQQEKQKQQQQFCQGIKQQAMECKQTVCEKRQQTCKTTSQQGSCKKMKQCGALSPHDPIQVSQKQKQQVGFGCEKTIQLHNQCVKKNKQNKQNDIQGQILLTKQHVEKTQRKPTGGFFY